MFLLYVMSVIYIYASFCFDIDTNILFLMGVILYMTIYGLIIFIQLMDEISSGIL